MSAADLATVERTLKLLEDRDKQNPSPDDKEQPASGDTNNTVDGDNESS